MQKLQINKLIKRCFNKHKKDLPIEFTFEEYESFWKQDKPNKKWFLVNRDKTKLECEVIYYPLWHKSLRALVVIGNYDYREVPVRFLEPNDSNTTQSNK